MSTQDSEVNGFRGYVQPFFDGLPSVLKSTDRWLCWRGIMNREVGKPRKTPISLATMEPAGQIDCRVPLAAAVEAIQRDSQLHIGYSLGPVEENDSLIFVDLDEAVDIVQKDGKEPAVVVKLWAKPIVERFQPCYTELSPSGTGIHLLVRGRIDRSVKVVHEDRAVEVYCHGRYLAMTGWQLDGSADDIPDRQEQLDALIAEMHQDRQGNHVRYAAGRSGGTSTFVSSTLTTDRDYQWATRLLLEDAIFNDLVDDYDSWLKMGMALSAKFGEAGLNLWDSWSRNSAKWEPGACQHKYRSFKHDNGGLSFGSFVAWARQRGVEPPRSERRRSTQDSGQQFSSDAQGDDMGQQQAADEAGADTGAHDDCHPTLDYSASDHVRTCQRYPLLPFAASRGTHHKAARFLRDHHRLLRTWKGDVYQYDAEAGRYRPLAEADLAQDVRVWMVEDNNVILDVLDHKQCYDVSTAAVKNVVDAVKSFTALPEDLAPEAPAWTGEVPDGMPAGDCIAFTNGLVNARTGAMSPIGPGYFNLSNVGYAYTPSDEVPQAWFSFLRSIWGDDWASAIELQKWFGYCCTTDDRFHKMLLLIGPPRAGKGTIQQALHAVLGEASVISMPVVKLAKDFGLASLIGKNLAIFPDVVMPRDATVDTITENLLSISGGDRVSISRKWKEDWHGKLGVKFMMTSNSLPRFASTSGGLASRLHVLTLSKSFVGQEDRTLGERIHAERHLIVNWAIQGLEMLLRDGFKATAGGTQVAEEVRELAEPTVAFVRECLTSAGPDDFITPTELYAGWKKWCDLTGHAPGSRHSFVAKLNTSGLVEYKLARRGGERCRMFIGHRWQAGANPTGF